MIMRLLYALIVVIGGIAYGVLLGGIARKITARNQNRRGPTIFQNYIDLLKLFTKKTAISHGVMFYLGPTFRFLGGIVTFLLVPIVIGNKILMNFSFAGDIFVILYAMVFGLLGMALGASESGHPHPVIGITRGLSQMAGYELPFLLSVIGLMVVTGSTSLQQIVIAQQGGLSHWFAIKYPFLTIAALLSMLGMYHSYPFGVVMAPQEIAIGPPTEYQSSFITYMRSGGAIFGVAKYLLFMDLFFGGATNLLEAFIKTFILFLWPLFVSNVFPRYRLEQAFSFFWTYPTVIGLIDFIRIFIKRG